MATQVVDITDPGGVNFAVVKNAALVESDYGLVVRAIVSPANNSFSPLQIAIDTGPFRISNGGPDPNRRFVRIKNATAYNLFLAKDNTVTVGNGYLLSPGEVETFELGPNVQIWGIGATGAMGTIYSLELG
jgi:hypothetical protein